MQNFQLHLDRNQITRIRLAVNWASIKIIITKTELNIRRSASASVALSDEEYREKVKSVLRWRGDDCIILKVPLFCLLFPLIAGLFLTKSYPLFCWIYQLMSRALISLNNCTYDYGNLYLDIKFLNCLIDLDFYRKLFWRQSQISDEWCVR